MTDFRFMEYDKKVMDEADLDQYCGFIEDFLQQQQNAYIKFVKRAEEHIRYIKHCDKTKNYYVTGDAYEEDGWFYLNIAKIYGDKSVKHEHYDFDTMQEQMDKLDELKQVYDVEWRDFRNQTDNSPILGENS